MSTTQRCNVSGPLCVISRAATLWLRGGELADKAAGDVAKGKARAPRKRDQSADEAQRNEAAKRDELDGDLTTPASEAGARPALRRTESLRIPPHAGLPRKMHAVVGSLAMQAAASHPRVLRRNSLVEADRFRISAVVIRTRKICVSFAGLHALLEPTDKAGRPRPPAQLRRRPRTISQGGHIGMRTSA